VVASARDSADLEPHSAWSTGLPGRSTLPLARGVA
jgi:hypothetical protein